MHVSIMPPKKPSFALSIMGKPLVQTYSNFGSLEDLQI